MRPDQNELKECLSLATWLDKYKIDQKKEDAIKMLQHIQMTSELHFENTVFWHNMKKTIDEQIVGT